MPRLPKVCIIGAGSSGITVAKAMQDRAIPFDCFEKGSDIGGNWCFKNSNGLSSAYRSLHINTSRTIMQYEDYPMPEDYPTYPGHALIKKYFDSYVDHFGLRSRITFNTSVEKAVLNASGTWQITLSTGECRTYDVLIVANGHHWDPRWPEPKFAGSFNGVEIHSHSYIDPKEPVDMYGKRVLVVGMGNSAMDIACELCRPGIAERLFLSARRGVWILPKFIFGKPTDLLARSSPIIPWWVMSWVMHFLLKLSVGSPWDYGLPRPDHRLLTAHPTISQDIQLRLGSGDITPKPDIARLSGDSVEFVDGSREKIDVIVYCTGYKVSFPFFDPEFISAPNNYLPLWKRIVKPELRNLFFVGLLQPLGAIMPIAERQGRFIGDYLIGRIALPSEEQMRKEMEQEHRAMLKRYVASPRHTMQVDFSDYLRQLEKETARGRRLLSSSSTPHT